MIPSSSRHGNAFIIVIGVLALIFVAASFFMTGTIEEGRTTQMSLRGIQAGCLAEAAIERALRIIASGVNDPNSFDTAKGKADSVAVKLRLPLKRGGASGIAGKSDNLGNDEQLTLDADGKKEVVLTKADLQADGADLDDLVKFMTQEAVKSWDATVKISVNRAFMNAPGKDYPEYKVPGVDLKWSVRPDVQKFLNGDGYTAMIIKFPPEMSWLRLKIPIEIGIPPLSVKICDINIVTCIDKLLPPGLLGGTSLERMTSLDFLADKLFNELLYPGKNKYPIRIPFDKVTFPKTVGELWPSGVSVNATLDDQQCLEKYGELKIVCESTLTGQDGYKAQRRIEAIKEFKVADVEPPAPMYSCFIQNLANTRLMFNSLGGDFYVNNFDYGGMWGKVTDVFTGNSAALPDAELEKREFPGLVRVNYKDPTGKNAPILVNVSTVGDWSGPKAFESDSSLQNMLRGVEALAMIDFKSRMALTGGTFNVNANLPSIDRSTPTNVPVPSGAGSTAGSGNTTAGGAMTGVNDHGVDFQTRASTFVPSSIQGAFKQMMDGMDLNLLPDIGRMSTNVIQLAATLMLKPLGSIVPAGTARMTDCFQKWEMPFMGTPNSVYTIPTPGVGNNKTHFFGAGALHPPMTREVEGRVLKQYRQWNMCIVGMNTTDRLPLLPFPPFIVPPAPIVVPIWYSATVQTKYDFNLEMLKSMGVTGQPFRDCENIDPSMMSNAPPNLYTNEQYAKKATYYYKNQDEFLADIPNRLTNVGGKKVFVLNGISYISGSLGSVDKPFIPKDDAGANLEKFYVVGKGMIACSGNVFLGCDIRSLDKSVDDRTVFTLMVRNGGLLVMPTSGGMLRTIEGSVFTDKGLFVDGNSAVHIIGNWVTNGFNKGAMMGKVTVDYVSSRVRSSLGSLHPERGKFDPRRYYVTFSPTWASWRTF